MSEEIENIIDATESAVALAEENTVDLNEVEGTGQNGRITKGDVQKFITARNDTSEQDPSGDDVVSPDEPPSDENTPPEPPSNESDPAELEISSDTIVSVQLRGAKSATLAGRAILQNHVHQVRYSHYLAARRLNPSGIFAIRLPGSNEFVVE